MVVVVHKGHSDTTETTLRAAPDPRRVHDMAHAPFSGDGAVQQTDALDVLPGLKTSANDDSTTKLSRECSSHIRQTVDATPIPQGIENSTGSMRRHESELGGG